MPTSDLLGLDASVDDAGIVYRVLGPALDHDADGGVLPEVKRRERELGIAG